MKIPKTTEIFDDSDAGYEKVQDGDALASALAMNSEFDEDSDDANESMDDILPIKYTFKA